MGCFFLDRAGGGARRRKRTGESGYSLLEVLIVLTIIALIAALVGPRLLSQLDRSKVRAAEVQMATFAASLDLLKVDLGRYPTDQEGLRLLVEPPAAERDRSRWRGPYLDAAVPSDPWDAPYVYQAPETEFARPTVKSLGADGAEGGDGLAADIIHGVPAT